MLADLDPTIAALCDGPAPRSPYANVSHFARMTWRLGKQLELAAADFARMLAPPTRLHTGYHSKAERTASKALAYSEGLLTPPARETAADRAKAEAVKWGLA